MAVRKPLVMVGGLPTSTALADTDIAGTTAGALPYVISGVLGEGPITFDTSIHTLSVGDATLTTGLNLLGVSGTFALAASGSIFERISANANAPVFSFEKSRGTTVSSKAVVVTNDVMLNFRCLGYDGVSAYRLSAQMEAVVIETTPGPTAMAGRWLILASAAGAVTSTEIARLDVANGLSMYGANIVVDANRLVQLRVFTVATLPTAPGDGRTGYIADGALALGFGTAVGAGGGTNHMPVYYNSGTAAWMIG